MSTADVEFERSKIFEKLNYKPEPEHYNGKLPWIVQQQISATNGIQYGDLVGKLKDYPQYELPIKKVPGGIMLDIGCGWGRWLVSGSRKGYIPVGADLRLEFCKASLETMKAQKINGYTVAADLKDLPFNNNSFDFVWSFSVIQHTHKERMLACLQHINRILKSSGFTKLEFPNSKGIHNYYGPAKKSLQTADDYNSWVVRYYTISQYRDIFLQVFHNYKSSVHSMLGIGVLKEDLKYVSLKNKILCGISLLGSSLAKIFPPLKGICDSIYITATKQTEEPANDRLKLFNEAHQQFPGNNLNIIYLLQCPHSGEDLKISTDQKYVETINGGIKYPVIDNIPVVIRSEAIFS